MGKTLYRVKVREVVNGGYPQTRHDLVMATDPHTALDKVKESLDEKDSLYDEPIQRSIVNDEIKKSRIERKYSDYIKNVEYIA